MSQAVLLKEYKGLAREKWVQIDVGLITASTYDMDLRRTD